MIITNTYQATVDGFVEHLGVTAEQGYGLIVRAVELAKKARTLYMEEYQDYVQDGKVLISFLFMKLSLKIEVRRELVATSTHF